LMQKCPSSGRKLKFFDARLDLRHACEELSQFPTLRLRQATDRCL
jgi:hypothetical protein